MLNVIVSDGGFQLNHGEVEIGWWKRVEAAVAARSAARYLLRVGADPIRIKLAAREAARPFEEEPHEAPRAA